MPSKKTIYHWSGPAELYTIDARSALQNHPSEWRDKEWSAEEALKAAQAAARREGVEYDKSWQVSQVPEKLAQIKAEREAEKRSASR